MNKIVLAAAIAASVAAFPALAEEDSAVDPLLTIWTRDATDYNAFSKVAERYTKETGIKVKIENQEQSEIKFEKAASAARVRTSTSGRMTASASGRTPAS